MSRIDCGTLAIDLGTTNSLIAYYDGYSRRGETITNPVYGRRMTSSAVLFEKGQDEGGQGTVGETAPPKVVVGQEAKENALLYPERTAMFFKRLMGKEAVAIRVDQKDYSPQQLSAYVLKALADAARKELDREVHKVVITVPAYFNSNAIMATREAGEMAGLEVVATPDEPFAALLHCISMREMEDMDGKTMLIVDMGGGTLDMVAVQITDRVIDEIAISGDVHLGGSDFDLALADYIRKKYLKGIRLSPEDEQEFRVKIEEAKISLSRREKIDNLLIPTENRRIGVPVTREEFEMVSLPLMARVRGVVRDLMNDLFDKGISQFDKIILVGGACRMPQISSLFRQLFPFTDMSIPDPDEAVAKGAAVYAKMLEDSTNPYEIRHSFEVKNVRRASSRSYGIETAVEELDAGSRITNLIYKNAELPVTAKEKFLTRYDNQKEARIRIFETLSSKRFAEVDDKYLLGSCNLEIRGNLPKRSEIEIEMTLNEDGTLTVTGREPKGNTKIRTTMSSKALLSPSNLVAQKKVVDETKIL